jgi:hypothetical protein
VMVHIIPTAKHTLGSGSRVMVADVDGWWTFCVVVFMVQGVQGSNSLGHEQTCALTGTWFWTGT